MDRARRVTIRDVAKAAGVSITTVSNSLSGKGELPASTRSRVAEVARSLGYTVDSHARQFRKGRTGSVGLYFPGRVIGLDAYMETALGAAEAALARDLALTLMPAWRNADRIAKVRVDGLIVLDPMLGDPVLDTLSRLAIPVVTNERDLNPEASYASGVVESDHVAAVRELLEHLTAQGATRIALIAPACDTAWGAGIHAAYRQWCEGHGNAPLVREVGFISSPGEVGRAAEELLSETPAIDAIVSAPDGAAIWALQAAERRGRRAPADILIASCCDDSSTRLSLTPITAIDLHARLVGQECANLLADILDGVQPDPAVRTLPTHLIERASTKRN